MRDVLFNDVTHWRRVDSKIVIHRANDAKWDFVKRCAVCLGRRYPWTLKQFAITFNPDALVINAID